MNSASSQELKQPVLSTIEVKVPPATCAGTSSMLKTNQTVLFAIPAPRSMGNGMLCMCRKIFWTNDNLVHCAYIPVSKEEATQLLSGPSSINVLQNPGSQLLTVSSTGAIIGIQQTVGIIKTKTPVLVTQKIERETTPLDGIKMPCAVPHTASIPDQAVKVSSNSPTLRHSTTTPKKITPTSTATCDIPMSPKISAVYSLAEHSARSASTGTTLVSSNKYAFAIAHPQETPVDIKSGNVIKERAARTLTERVNDKTDPSVLKSLPNDEALQTNPKGHSSIASVKKNTLSEQEKDLKKHNTEGTNRRSSNIMSKDSTNKGLGEAVPKPYSKNYVRESAKTPADVIPLDLTKKVLSNKRPAHNVTDNRTYNQTAQRAINKQSKITRTIQSVTVPLREETPLDLSNRVTSTLTSKTFSVSSGNRTYPSVEQSVNDSAVDLTLKYKTHNPVEESVEKKVKAPCRKRKVITSHAIPNKQKSVAVVRPIEVANESAVSEHIKGDTRIQIEKNKEQRVNGIKRKSDDSTIISNRKRKVTASKKSLKVQFSWDKKSKDDGNNKSVEQQAMSQTSNEVQSGTFQQRDKFNSETKTATPQGVSPSTDESVNAYLYSSEGKKIEHKMWVIDGKIPLLRLTKLDGKAIRELGGNVSCDMLVEDSVTKTTLSKTKVTSKEGKKKKKKKKKKNDIEKRMTKLGKEDKKKKSSKKETKKTKKIRKLNKKMKKSRKDVEKRKKSGKVSKEKKKSRKDVEKKERFGKETKNKKICKKAAKEKTKTETAFMKLNKTGNDTKKDKFVSHAAETVADLKLKKKQPANQAKERHTIKSFEGLNKEENEMRAKGPNAFDITEHESCKPKTTEKLTLKMDTTKTPQAATNETLPLSNEKTDNTEKSEKEEGNDIYNLPHVMSIEAFTHLPDIDHIPTTNKVAYLKEMLKVQRSAMGIHV